MSATRATALTTTLLRRRETASNDSVLADQTLVVKFALSIVDCRALREDWDFKSETRIPTFKARSALYIGNRKKGKESKSCRTTGSFY